MTELMSDLKREVTRAMIQAAAGRAMFCETCRGILDWSRTVVLENEVGAMVQCAKCFDAHLARLTKRLKRDITATDLRETGTEVDDGRDFA